MNQDIEIKVGPEILLSYRRLDYTSWHAIAEYVDNSTQSYLERAKELAPVIKAADEQFFVSIDYNKRDKTLRVTDNAYGMSRADLVRAMEIGHPPVRRDGRSEYGLGLKTASGWMGRHWEIRTKQFGSHEEFTLTVDLEKLERKEKGFITTKVRQVQDKGKHYTNIEIGRLYHEFHTKTIAKIRDYLSSMYREDITSKRVRLEFMGVPLEWTYPDLRNGPDGTAFKHEFEFKIGRLPVSGWVGILKKGTRSKAGFSIMRRGRVIRGWPDSWRPESIFGDARNDLINQRLVGEVVLDDFEVTHTKDNIQWYGDQYSEVLDKLAVAASTYAKYAQSLRKDPGETSGPTPAEQAAALDALREELESKNLLDRLKLSEGQDPALWAEEKRRILAQADKAQVEMAVRVGKVSVEMFLQKMSTNDKYVYVESNRDNKVLVIVNTCHPHWEQISGAEGLLNYYRHCIYDGLAQWRAHDSKISLEPDTIRNLKDVYLRVGMEIEDHGKK